MRQNPDHHRYNCISSAEHGTDDNTNEALIAAARQIGFGKPDAAQEYH